MAQDGTLADEGHCGRWKSMMGEEQTCRQRLSEEFFGGARREGSGKKERREGKRTKRTRERKEKKRQEKSCLSLQKSSSGACLLKGPLFLHTDEDPELTRIFPGCSLPDGRVG